jgi:hypothetical protein
MKFTMLLTTILILSSCAPIPKEVTLPSGEQGLAVRCEEFLSKCYQQASKSCPNGYEIKDKTTASNFLVPVYDLMIVCK